MTVSLGVVMVEKPLTSVSPSELVFTDQKVGSLVIVPEAPNVCSVIRVKTLPQLPSLWEDLTPSDLP